ncbi:MAG: hypothetical protein LBI99_06735, partial [Propionibacteriaceae bacterium]|nr:hypothetical protein [Propionibacteriaceae bacterium]
MGILREELQTPYPLASSAVWLRQDGKELVARVQTQLGDKLEEELRVVRTGDIMLPGSLAWTDPSQRFHDAILWEGEQI